jgi:hypothetical protein
MLGNCRVATQLVASRVVLSSIELVEGLCSLFSSLSMYNENDQVKKDDMDRGCSTHAYRISLGKSEEDADGKIILKWVLER